MDTSRSGRAPAARRLVASVLALCLALPLAPGTAAQDAGEPAASAPTTAPLHLVPPADAELAAAAAMELDERPASPDTLPSFEAVREQARVLLDSLPEADWDIPALAEALDYDPDRAFAFVRDSIGLDPYPGVLRGAEGTLAARSGSPADRALLLAALLDSMEVPYRFAGTTLDEVAATALVDRAAAGPTAPIPGPGLGATPVFPADVIVSRAARDFAQLTLALRDGDPAGGLPAVGERARTDAVEAMRDHVWVQRRSGARWLDLDPTLPTSIPGATLAPATSTMDLLPDTLDHRVLIRLEQERLVGDALVASPLLVYEAPAREAAASELFLLFAPLSESVGGSIRELLTGDVEWYPILMVDGIMRRGEPMRVASSGTDVFGTPEDPGPPLAAVRLVVETSGPDGDERRIERMLLDRVPAGSRASGRVDESSLEPLAEDDGVLRFTAVVRHIMVSTGGMDLRDFAEQRYLAADYAGSSLLVATLADPPAPYGAVWPIATSDAALVVASETAVVPAVRDDSGARAFVDGPRVYLTSAGRDPYRPASLAFAIDLAIDRVAVVPGTDPESAARLQLWYAALQTALESRLALQRAALLDPEARELSGASIGARGDLRVVDPAAPPPDAPPALLADLASDATVLRWDGDDAARAWWVVDAADGATRSMIDPGLGGALPAGRPLLVARTSDSSYTHGKGPRLPPRPPQAPQAPGGYGARKGCTGGSEDTAIMCNVSLWGYFALSFNLTPVLVLTLEAAAFALIAYYVATG